MDTKICKYCKKELPISQFYTDNQKKDKLRPRCKDCDRISRDLEKRREYEKRYWGERKERKSAILAGVYLRHKERYRAVQNEYRKTAKFKENHYKHISERRARFHNAFVEHVDYNKLYNESGGKCFYCGKDIERSEVEFDHFIPISKGGKHETKNMRVSCQFCNRSKGAKILEVGYQVV